MSTGNDAASSTNWSLRLKITSGDVEILDGNDVVQATITAPFTAGEWHTVRVDVEYDLTAGQIKFTVDDDTPTTVSSIDTVTTGSYLVLQGSTTTDDGDLLIDTAAVYNQTSFADTDLPDTIKKSNPYQNAGTGWNPHDASTDGSNPDSGSIADAGDLPFNTSTEARWDTNNSKGGADTDGSLRSGPSGDSALSGVTILGCKWLFAAQRTTGSDSTPEILWGDDADTFDSGLYASGNVLGTATQWWDYIGESGGTYEPPTTSQYFTWGARKGSGGRDVAVREFYGSILYEPAAAEAGTTHHVHLPLLGVG